MKVEHEEQIDDGHSLELGGATWNPNDRSVRNRFATSDGRFNPHSSSEIPIGDLVRIMVFVAEHDELSVRQCAEIIEALSASIVRRAPR